MHGVDEVEEACGILLVHREEHDVVYGYEVRLGYPSFAAVCTINSIKVVKYRQISAK